MTFRTLDFLWCAATLVACGWLSIIDPQGNLLTWFTHSFWRYLLGISMGPAWFMICVVLHFVSEELGI